jgi:hypothetical protein
MRTPHDKAKASKSACAFGHKKMLFQGVTPIENQGYTVKYEADGHIPFWIESCTALPAAVDRQLSARRDEYRSFRGASEPFRLRLISAPTLR